MFSMLAQRLQCVRLLIAAGSEFERGGSGKFLCQSAVTIVDSAVNSKGKKRRQVVEADTLEEIAAPPIYVTFAALTTFQLWGKNSSV